MDVIVDFRTHALIYDTTIIRFHIDENHDNKVFSAFYRINLVLFPWVMVWYLFCVCVTL